MLPVRRDIQRVNSFRVYINHYPIDRELQIGDVVACEYCLDGSKTKPICFQLTLKMLWLCRLSLNPGCALLCWSLCRWLTMDHALRLDWLWPTIGADGFPCHNLMWYSNWVILGYLNAWKKASLVHVCSSCPAWNSIIWFSQRLQILSEQHRPLLIDFTSCINVYAYVALVYWIHRAISITIIFHIK